MGTGKTCGTGKASPSCPCRKTHYSSVESFFAQPPRFCYCSALLPATSNQPSPPTLYTTGTVAFQCYPRFLYVTIKALDDAEAGVEMKDVVSRSAAHQRRFPAGAQLVKEKKQPANGRDSTAPGGWPIRPDLTEAIDATGRWGVATGMCDYERLLRLDWREEA